MSGFSINLGGGFGGFNLGSGIFKSDGTYYGGFGNLADTSPKPVTTQTDSTPTGASNAGANGTNNSGSIWGNVISAGADIFKTVLGYSLAGQQVKAGQYPTAVGQNGNMAGTANVSAFSQGAGLPINSSWLLLGLGAVLLIMLFKK
jgi:hypothetical protein